jgi:hypothetical protein
LGCGVADDVTKPLQKIRLTNMNTATASATPSTKLDPLISEFDTEEQAASYDRWFRAKVQEALDDPRPAIPHDEAMKMVQEEIERRRALRAAD